MASSLTTISVSRRSGSLAKMSLLVGPAGSGPLVAGWHKVQLGRAVRRPHADQGRAAAQWQVGCGGFCRGLDARGTSCCAWAHKF